MKRALWLLVIMALLATACSSSRNAAPTTITWSYWGDPDEASVDERIVTLFEHEHPEIHVQTRGASYNDYFNLLEGWWQNGDAPDVAFLNFIPAYAARGLLADLTPLVSRDHYDLSDFYPALLDGFKYNGALYGLPRDNDTKVIFYNKDLFDAKHVSYPQAGWTWADLRRTAMALTDRNANPPQYGFAFEPHEWWKLWVWQNGGDIFDDPTHPNRTVLDSAATVDALTFLRNLIHTDRVTPPVDDLASSERIGNLFVGGQVAMAFGNHALVPPFAAAQTLHWGVIGLPQSVKQVNYAGGAGYVISAASQRKQAAWTFLTWLLSSKGEAIFTESGVIVPSRRSVGNSNLFLHQSIPALGVTGATEVGRVFVAETEKGKAEAVFPGSTGIANAINDGLQPIWAADADPQTVLDALTPRIDGMLKERK